MLTLEQCRAKLPPNDGLPHPVPSVEQLTHIAGWNISDEAQARRLVVAQQFKEILAGRSSQVAFQVGPCAVTQHVIMENGKPYYDVLAFQDSSRQELTLATDSEAVLSRLAEHELIQIRGGLRKPRSGEGWRGIAADDPLAARYLAMRMANHAADHPHPALRFGLSTELAHPSDFELKEYYGLFWAGARADQDTTLRDHASSPVMDAVHAAALLAIQEHGGQNLEDLLTETETSNPRMYQLLRGLGNVSVAEASEIIREQNRMPFLFKNGVNGSLDTAIAGIEAAAKPQTNTFIGRDGRQYGPLTTLGNPYTGLLFRGGTSGLTPEDFRNDLLETQRRLDSHADNPKINHRIAWGVDFSHHSAKQCANGKRTEQGQVIAHQITMEEVAAGRIQPSFFMAEAQVHTGAEAPHGRWGISPIDPCVDAKTAAQMAVDIAGTTRKAY